MATAGSFEPFTISVPATTANLGPGFDCLGLALDLWNRVRVSPSKSLQITIEGEGAGHLPTNSRNLVYRSAVRAARDVGTTLPPLRLEMENAIPLTRGLGSSAAATIAGILIVDRLGGGVFDQGKQLSLAVDLEGHADNAAPALWGGACLAIEGPESTNLVRTLPFPDGLACALLVPDVTMSTREARSVLSRRVPRTDAVFNIGRVALLVHALSTGSWDDLGLATEDRLHQPQRATLMPITPNLIKAAREAGAFGAFLSGAGPTVLALSAPDRARDVANAMEREALDNDLPARSLVVAASRTGAAVVAGIV
jgi:homoserine kinase